MEKKSIRLTNGETYSYIEKNNGNDVLLMVHGNLSSSIFLKPYINQFEGHRVIAIDLRGFGDSTYNTPIKSFDDYCTDLKLFIDELQIDSLSILGWSSGGLITMRFASMYPDIVNKIILQSPPSYRGYTIFQKDKNKELLPGKFYYRKEDLAKDPVTVIPVNYMLLNKDREAARKLYNKYVFSVNQPSKFEYEVLIDEILKQQNLIDFDWALTTFNMSSFSNGITLGDNSILKVTHPVLLLYGDKDLTVLEYMIEETEEALPNFKRVNIDKAGHAMQYDQLELLVSQIKAFLKE